MIKFEDLTPKDQEKLLQQAREIIDEENLKKDAITVYKIKRKELTEKNLQEIYSALKLKYETDKNHFKQRYTAMVNFFFKESAFKDSNKSHRSFPPSVRITNPSEWRKFVIISEEVKNVTIRCCTVKEDEEDGKV